MRPRLIVITLIPWLVGCGREVPRAGLRRPITAADPGFARVQARGAVAMGVNQYTSSHVFEPLADGGRVALQRDLADSAGAARIGRHMKQIASQFAAGDFRLPGFVHATEVPGTAVMSAKRALISYTVEPLPRGAALRVRSEDADAVRAIHQFLAFQRQDHHASAGPDS
jgi:hypothetical protein